MINEQINQLRELANWVRVNIGKSANFDISIWCHTSSTDESIEYRFWIDGMINESSQSLDGLVGMIPKFKEYCVLNRELKS